MNKLLGDDNKTFAAKRQVKSVTQQFQHYETKDFVVLDTPGLGDLNMPFEAWVAKLNSSPYVNCTVALVLMCLKASIRPSVQDRSNIQVMVSAIESLKPTNVCDVITFIEDDPEDYDMESQKDFLAELYNHTPEVKCPPQSKVFLFKGKSKNGATATSTKEINDWIRQIIPTQPKD